MVDSMEWVFCVLGSAMPTRALRIWAQAVFLASVTSLQQLRVMMSQESS